jgi:hypothetical protein
MLKFLPRFVGVCYLTNKKKSTEMGERPQGDWHTCKLEPDKALCKIEQTKKGLGKGGVYSRLSGRLHL